MVDGWYYWVMGDQPIGPLSFVELRQRFQGGNLMPDTYVRQSKAEGWVLAESVNGLFDTPNSQDITAKAKLNLEEAKLDSQHHARQERKQSEFVPDAITFERKSRQKNKQVHPILGVLIVSVFLWWLFNSTNSSSSTRRSNGDSSSSSLYEKSYQHSRELDRQHAYDALRDNGAPANQAEPASKTVQEIVERDRQIRAGTYSKP